MALKFYYAPMTVSMLTDDILKELNIPFEKITLKLEEGDHKKPEYLAVNPNGTVPTIVHDGVPIFETAAITMYLGEMFGVEKGLYPPPGTKRGQAMKWLVWAMVTLGNTGAHYGACVGALRPHDLRFLTPEERTPEKKEKAFKALGASFGVLNSGLEGRRYMLGEEFSLVDAHLMSVANWIIYAMKFDIAPYENVAKWMKRCTERSKGSSEAS